MRKNSPALALLAAAAATCVGLSGPPASSAQKLQYPQTRKVEHTDTYHGVKVADPYRWLEDDRSAETARWVEEQNRVTFSYLEKIPYRQRC